MITGKRETREAAVILLEVVLLPERDDAAPSRDAGLFD
jgi:hypothetical protein